MSDEQCIVEGCSNAVSVKSRGLCKTHYLRWHRYGDVHARKRVQSYGETRCIVVPCGRRAQALGYCGSHFSRMKATGAGTPPDRAEVLLSHTRRVPRGCWAWTGAGSAQGYGTYGNTRGGTVLAHRLVYELLVGPIPEGLTLDHLCRNRRCVNPAHLEPVTIAENVMRGEGFAARNARKTHCLRGHPYDEANTYIIPSTGHRQCRACQAEYARTYKRPAARRGGDAR